MPVEKSKHATHSRVFEQSNVDTLKRASDVLKGSESALRRSRELLEQSREVVKHSEKLQQTFENSIRNSKANAR